MLEILKPLLMVAGAMYIIKYACDSFEDASDHLGKKVYKMKPGIRGATIEAIASSLPELFTTLFLLFIYNDVGGFAAGIATCAGSAVFNMVLIPAVCIIAVTSKGVKGQVIQDIPLKQSTLLRDGFFFLLAELVLIYFLSFSALAWWMGLGLIIIYSIYFFVLMRGMNSDENEEDSEEDEDDDDDGDSSFVVQLLTFDYNQLLYKGADFTKSSAWVVLSCATATIAFACYFLSEAVIESAEVLDIAPYFTAVILGAAATSVPDTVISVKDSLKGDYDDAISNAVGSNIFDICVALGLPLLVYSALHGAVDLQNSSDGSENVQDLRVALIAITVFTLGLFFAGKSIQEEGETYKVITKKIGWFLVLIYLLWTTFVIAGAAYPDVRIANLLQ